MGLPSPLLPSARTPTPTDRMRSGKGLSRQASSRIRRSRLTDCSAQTMRSSDTASSSTPLRQAAVGVQKAAELIRYTVKRYCGRGLVAGYELAYISGSFSCRYVGGQRPVQQAKHRDFANAMESHVQGGSAFWPQIRALGWPLISDRHRKSLADANFPLRTGR